MEHNTKLMGGIAYIVLIASAVLGSFLPFAGVITLAAAVFVVVAFINAGGELNRPDVKSSMILALVLYIVGSIIILIVAGAAMVALFAGGSSAALAALGVGAVLGGLVGWILLIVAAWFWYKASKSVAEGSGVGLFKTGGLLMFIGMITSVVFVGLILLLIGEILQCVAFFQAPEKQPA